MEDLVINKLILDAVETLYNFVVVDKEEKVVYINKSYAEMLGTSSEEAVGKNVKDVIPNTLMPQILKTGRVDIGSIFKVFNHITREEQTMICNRYPIINDGKIEGVLAVTLFMNIEETNMLNQEIRLLKQNSEFYKSQLDELRGSKYSMKNMLGKSPKMMELKELVYNVADSNLPILITGETGVGKEVYSNAIHQLSDRRTGNFVKINCAAIPKDLLEAELFGYEGGSFTGANSTGKIGKFEFANNGTLLLDEISEMPMALQSKLLRVLQERELDRVGGLKPIKLNFRLISTTNKNIYDLIKQGKFREDLFYRINSVEIKIPPLRERFEDLPLLCEYFIDKTNKENGLDIVGMEDDVIPFLKTYKWYGNIRELENAIERACILKRTGKITVLQFNFLKERMKNMDERGSAIKSLDKIEEVKMISEREEIIKALEKTNGNKTKAAKLLNISRSILYNKINKYEINL